MAFEIQRRRLLTSLPVAAALAAITSERAGAQNRAASGSTLVVCFSRTGNTAVIAGQIRRAKGADLVRIGPVTPYPEDYEETVEQARRETDTGFLPPLQPLGIDAGRYDTIYLGFPIWGMTAPPVIRSFLNSNEMSGKTLYPFITHGGYGLGNSIDVVAAHARDASIQPAFSMEADQERRTLEQVTGWLGRS